MTLSGQKPEGGDATNPLTWLCLESLERFHADAPNVELRVHRDTPRELLARAAGLLARGWSMPALVNDEPIIAAMVERGIASNTLAIIRWSVARRSSRTPFRGHL